jgi:hypothetical protein
MKKLNKRVISLLSLAIGLACTSGVQAAWTLGSSTGAAGTAVNSNVSLDPTVKVTGIYAANGTGNAGLTGNWTQGTLQTYPGLGMSTGLDSGSPTHALDNNVNTEALLLDFSNVSVTLSGIGLSYAVDANQAKGPVDVSLFRWVGAATDAKAATIGQAATMSGWQLVGNYGNMTDTGTNLTAVNAVNTANLGSSWWLISAYNSTFASSDTSKNIGSLDNGNDFFKIYSVNGTKCTSTAAGVCSPSKVPEPTSLALFGAGLLGLIGARRRRNAAAV